MKHRQQHAYLRTGPEGHATGYVVGMAKAPAKTRLCQDVKNPIVYFLRMKRGAIKIGTTKGHLDDRLRWSGCTLDDVLIFTPGYFEEEREIHERFDAYSLGHELFRPAPELIQFINALRTNAGLKAVEPWS